ncbi:MAG: hypothetical protein J5529_04365 [Prevotella sp.]|jgi:hypothetical protein|nr:hypothetical protein [Prevotella sp.]
MKKAFMMLVLFIVPFALQAQTKFHDVEANDAKGAVKSISSSRMGSPVLIKFTQDGKMQQDGMTDAVYDADGYIQSAKMKVNGQGMEMEITMKYAWENGKVKSQTIETQMGAFKSSNVYDDKGVLVKTVMDMGGQKMETPYTNYKFDAKGNWISRKASMMGQEMEEQRTIEYYE